VQKTNKRADHKKADHKKAFKPLNDDLSRQHKMNKKQLFANSVFFFLLSFFGLRQEPSLSARIPAELDAFAACLL
jgi:hypothetical protein